MATLLDREAPGALPREAQLLKTQPQYTLQDVCKCMYRLEGYRFYMKVQKVRLIPKSRGNYYNICSSKWQKAEPQRCVYKSEATVINKLCPQMP